MTGYGGCIGGLVEVQVLLRVVGLGGLGVVLGHWRPGGVGKTREAVDMSLF